MSTYQFKIGDLVRGTGKDEYSYAGTGVVLQVRHMKNLGSPKGDGEHPYIAVFVCLLDSDTGQQIWLFESRLTLVETETVP